MCNKIVSLQEELKEVCVSAVYSPSARGYADEIRNRISKLYQERMYIQMETMKVGMERHRLSEMKWIKRYGTLFDIIYDGGLHDPVSIQNQIDREWSSRPIRKK